MGIFTFFTSLFGGKKPAAPRPSNTRIARYTRYRRMLYLVGKELNYESFRPLDALAIAKECQINSSFILLLIELNAVERKGKRGKRQYRLLAGFERLTALDVLARSRAKYHARQQSKQVTTPPTRVEA